MATPRRVKRPRADSDATAATGAAAPDTTNAAGAADADGLSAQQLAELSAIVQGLPLAKVQALLLQAARDVPHVADAIRHEEAERKQREAQGVKRFNKYRNSAWRELRTAKDGVDAACEIEQTVEDILAQVLPHSSFGTKKNAAAAICDIYTWALQIDGMVGRRLRQNSYDVSSSRFCISPSLASLSGSKLRSGRTERRPPSPVMPDCYPFWKY